MKPYRPQKKTVAILDRAWKHVESVPYQVSLRWLFYRLLQDGIYRDKNDYRNKFIQIISRARKRFYKEWAPWTLVDDTRDAYNLPDGHANERDWLEEIQRLGCKLDQWAEQEGYGIIAFEAQAMFHQFAYYAPPSFSLWPFRGDPGIEYKWRLARHIRDALEKYSKPITVFYFGDLDPKGMEIARNAFRDIWPWTGVEFASWGHVFRFVRGGLNPGDEIRFDIPQNFEKLGEYQWEALTDEAARTLIEEALEGFYDPDKEESIREREERATKAYQEALDGLELRKGGEKG